MTSREGGREKEKERSTAHRCVEFSILHLGTEPVKYTDETNQRKSTKSTKWNWNAINKRCIYMQTLKDNYAQKESGKHVLLLDIQLWLKIAFLFFFFCLLNYSCNVTFIIVRCASQDGFC